MSARNMDTCTTTDGRHVLAVGCNRCGGRGFIPRYGHNFKGRCFKCDGAGIVSLSLRNTGRVLSSITRLATGRQFLRNARGGVGVVLLAALLAGCATSCPPGERIERRWFTIDTGSGVGIPASYTVCRPDPHPEPRP
jgi:hypothetical protein